MRAAQRPGRVITFYSYKGGTGRSMALANFAWMLAASGRKVLAIDWDLEAPGLHRYFRPFLVDPDLFETDGLIDTFWRFAATAIAQTSPSRPPTPPPDDEGFAGSLDDAGVRIDWSFPTGGYIDFIGAGRQSATYSERVNTFHWKTFYELGGARILVDARDRLRERYDWILIDSRTGVSDTSGVCTIQLPDTVVACFTMNRQSIDGVAAILRSIRAYRSDSADGSKIGFYPVATRIENAEHLRLETARGYARATLAEFLPYETQSQSRDYWDRMEITYRPAYAFEEVLAAFGDATGSTGAADTMLSQVEEMAQQITGDATLRMPEILAEDRNRVLAAYALGGKSSSKIPGNIVRDPLSGTEHGSDASRPGPRDSTDTDFLRSVLAKEQLWRQSGFRWRLLLSQRELDLLTDNDRKSFGRAVAYYVLQSQRIESLFRWTNVGFVGSFVVALLAGAGFYAFSVSQMSQLPIELRYQRAVLSSYLVAVPAWLISSLLFSALQRSGVPYGVSALDVLRLNWLGPFRPRVQDYEDVAKGP